MVQKHGLGRGLSSLIPQKDKSQTTLQKSRFATKHRDDEKSVKKEVAKKHIVAEEKKAISTPKTDFSEDKDYIKDIPVGQMRANAQQPRLSFDEDKLDELAASIRAHGILQPLVAVDKGDHFELISGERRLRASRKAGLTSVPVVVKKEDIDDQQKLELALIENIQRHDLNLIEEAKSYHRLSEEFNLPQEEIAVRCGKSRSVVANRMRLSTLPIEIQKGLITGTITEGHAKVILSLTNPQKRLGLYNMIVQNNLTVRQAENKAHTANGTTHRSRSMEKTPHARRLEDQLARYFGTKVRVSEGGKGGNITISYFSDEELKNILSRLKLI
ncbi:MAG: chromosome partitioning protein ParB [Candidatus Moraniibacteriota bacterium]|nr:MAG: chromosome partitioning protein ParB [Candidatus Moranbacteria bacterium]